MHNREHIVIVRPRKGGLTLHTMFYANEIRSADAGSTTKTEIKDAERALAQQLIKNLAAPFQPDKYHDGYQTRLREMIEDKAKGREIAAVPHVQRAPVIDLMAALKKSLEDSERGQKSLLQVSAPKAVESRKKSRRAG
jgi:DNA end-binding protein Ku